MPPQRALVRTEMQSASSKFLTCIPLPTFCDKTISKDDLTYYNVNYSKLDWQIHSNVMVIKQGKETVFCDFDYQSIPYISGLLLM